MTGIVELLAQLSAETAQLVLRLLALNVQQEGLALFCARTRDRQS